MKWFVFSIVLACTTCATAQFIPQPMGYNPDENGDALIGVNDLQGLLSLYGQPFDNGDSLVVYSLTFPHDMGSELVESSSSINNPWIYVPENTDVLYVHDDIVSGGIIEVFLPQSSGFKVLQVFLSSEDWGNVKFHTTADANLNAFESPVRTEVNYNCFLTFIRGHNGKWYEPLPKGDYNQ